ncbi:hypothetical protein LTR37_014968 [Vermiconidia calcicola]|uniref:Uncharacterized protein n=1 Tax=Vermiconidia calcicola TaxID=1690605 RepID=A0ACC3MSM4_9PEZI|nr:hypothetical protein LTR37_014968 [Vermiconidia calcicola]
MSTNPGIADTGLSNESRAEDRENKLEGIDDDAEHELDDLAEVKPKKKRKIVNTSDKKYECPHPECSKAYSRAEHLYRHQLNHTPKQIYRCEFPGCDRNFVRADLCARHKERHTAKGSHLQRKDAFLSSQRPTSASEAASPTGTPASNTSPGDINHTFQAPSTTDGYMSTSEVHSFPRRSDRAQTTIISAIPPMNTSNLDPQLGSYSTYTSNMNGSQQPSMSFSAPVNGQHFNHDGSFSTRSGSQFPTYSHYQTGPTNFMQPPSVSSPQSSGLFHPQQPYPSPVSTNQSFRAPATYTTLPSLPPFGLPHTYGQPDRTRSSSLISPPTVGSNDQHPAPKSRSNSVMDYSALGPIATDYSMPVFGDDTTFGRSPTNVDENFLNMLLSANGTELADLSPPEPEVGQSTPPAKDVPLPKLDPDGNQREQSLPSLSDGMDINIPESRISEKKQSRLSMLVNSLSEIDHDSGRMKKEDILAGDPQDSDHPMSNQMLKTYLSSYWLHIHQQMPILHRPTFNAETCPDLLLLTMMSLGATCLERVQPLELSKRSVEFAPFAADHVRWEVFKDAEFRPTAKLWTFQTMLLLELFEKMYSTRSLHERAHIHHATTLTVMRRGSSLIGRSANDESKNGEDDPTRTPPGPDGSINTSGQNTPDAYWNRWITAEATRRTAFAAFIIDSTHATLFGHSAVMSPHELRLPLPCDEALWSAASSAEVQRVEASLAANGFKPTSFLDGLRRTLNGQKVRTNTFGRVILMAGLLNVSWHMNQRDLQVSSLGAASTLGSQIKWRSPLTRAFDFWRRDFDESLSKNDHWLQICGPKNNDGPSTVHRDNVFESRTCLHSLAHMAMHVDIIDCQVFAGAERALGRLVTDGDRAVVQKRMRERWAPSARARDSTFYALRFLCEVLIPEEELSSKRTHPHHPPTFTYSARDDYLLNRPWILFFAALIVWSYGYALDGVIKPSNYTLTTRELQIFDMQRYLIRMGGVASPDDLENLKDRNSCLGLLLLLRERFQQPRWELLHEASETLTSCIELLVPGRGNEVRS